MCSIVHVAVEGSVHGLLAACTHHENLHSAHLLQVSTNLNFIVYHMQIVMTHQQLGYNKRIDASLKQSAAPCTAPRPHSGVIANTHTLHSGVIAKIQVLQTHGSNLELTTPSYLQLIQQNGNIQTSIL